MKLFIVLLVSYLAIASADDVSDIKDAWTKNYLIPDCFAEAPKCKLDITWILPDGTVTKADLGATTKTIGDVNTVPKLEYPCQAGVYYSEVCVDADPLRWRYRPLSQISYYRKGNIQGCDKTTGQTRHAYLKPTFIFPEVHRYFCCSFIQTKGETVFNYPIQNSTEVNSRIMTSIHEFAYDYALELQCCNLVNVKWDNVFFENFPALSQPFLPVIYDEIAKSNVTDPSTGGPWPDQV